MKVAFEKYTLIDDTNDCSELMGILKRLCTVIFPVKRSYIVPRPKCPH